MKTKEPQEFEHHYDDLPKNHKFKVNVTKITASSFGNPPKWTIRYGTHGVTTDTPFNELCDWDVFKAYRPCFTQAVDRKIDVGIVGVAHFSGYIFDHRKLVSVLKSENLAEVLGVLPDTFESETWMWLSVFQTVNVPRYVQGDRSDYAINDFIRTTKAQPFSALAGVYDVTGMSDKQIAEYIRNIAIKLLEGSVNWHEYLLKELKQLTVDSPEVH